jgi:hypothetical protein
MDTEFDEVIAFGCNDYVFDKKDNYEELNPLNTESNTKNINYEELNPLITESNTKNINYEELNTLITELNTKKNINSDQPCNQPNNEHTKNILCKGCFLKGTLIEDKNVLVCSNCGMINDELLNPTESEQMAAFAAIPTNFFNPETILTGLNNNRLKKKQKWSNMSYKKQKFNQVFYFISQKCYSGLENLENNALQNIINDAKFFYIKLNEYIHPETNKQIIFRGYTASGIIAACVFKSCEKNENPLDITEIADLFDLDNSHIIRGIKIFDKIMGYTAHDSI